jgi:hypothetical protein
MDSSRPLRPQPPERAPHRRHRCLFRILLRRLVEDCDKGLDVEHRRSQHTREVRQWGGRGLPKQRTSLYELGPLLGTNCP